MTPWDDPLGLTPDQRRQSDLAEAYGALMARWSASMDAAALTPPAMDRVRRANGGRGAADWPLGRFARAALGVCPPPANPRLVVVDPGGPS